MFKIGDIVSPRQYPKEIYTVVSLFTILGPSCVSIQHKTGWRMAYYISELFLVNVVNTGNTIQKQLISKRQKEFDSV